VIDQCASIDVSNLRRYLDLMEDHRLLVRRLERLETEKGKFSEQVYLRVRSDYEQQLAKLVREIDPLREEASISLDKLATLLPDLRQTVTSATYEREELELRRVLGEFTDEEIRPRIEALEERLKETAGQLAIFERLNERAGVALEGSESEEPKPSGLSVREPLGETIAQNATIPQNAVTAPASGEDERADLSAALVLEPAPVPELPRSEGTRLMKFAYVTLGDLQMEGQKKYYLGAVTKIGRSEQNQLHLDDTSVSRAHAEILFTPEGGYVIRDLASVNGTFVNGNQITQQALGDGDRVLIGSVSFRFHLGDNA